MAGAAGGTAHRWGRTAARSNERRRIEPCAHLVLGIDEVPHARHREGGAGRAHLVLRVRLPAVPHAQNCAKARRVASHGTCKAVRETRATAPTPHGERTQDRCREVLGVPNYHLVSADRRTMSAAEDTSASAEAAPPAPLAVLPSSVLAGVMALAELPNGRLAVASRTDVCWLDPVAGAHSGPYKCVDHRVSALKLVPDGRVVSFGPEPQLCLWTPDSGDCVRLAGHTRGVLSAVVLPDCRLASGSADGDIRIWNLSTGSCEAVIPTGHVNGMDELAVLSEGRLASCGRDGVVKCWDVVTSTVTAEYTGHDGAVGALLEVPGGWVVTGGVDDGTVRVFDAASRECVHTLSGHMAAVFMLRLLPDGRVASAGYDDKVRIFDAATGTSQRVLPGHRDGVRAMAVLPDGRLATCGDTTCRLWNLDSGACERVMEHEGSVWSMTVLDDGRIACGGAFGVRAWSV